MAKNKTTLPAEFSYFDKYLNRRIQLQPKPDEMVVTIAPRPADESGARRRVRDPVSFGRRFDGGALKSEFFQGRRRCQSLRGRSESGIGSQRTTRGIPQHDPGFRRSGRTDTLLSARRNHRAIRVRRE